MAVVWCVCCGYETKVFKVHRGWTTCHFRAANCIFPWLFLPAVMLRPDRYWTELRPDRFVEYEGLHIGLDTQWISLNDQKITTPCEFGFNPPCFMSTDDKGIVHIYTRQYYLQVQKAPTLRIIQRTEYHGRPFPKYCNRQQWGLKQEPLISGR